MCTQHHIYSILTNRTLNSRGISNRIPYNPCCSLCNIQFDIHNIDSIRLQLCNLCTRIYCKLRMNYYLAHIQVGRLSNLTHLNIYSSLLDKQCILLNLIENKNYDNNLDIEGYLNIWNKLPLRFQHTAHSFHCRKYQYHILMNCYLQIYLDMDHNLRLY